MKSYLRSLSMALFYMSLVLIEYRALPDAILGQKTGCSLKLLWVPTTLLLVQNTACTGQSSEVRETVERMFTRCTSTPVGPKTSEMPLSLSSRNREVFQTSHRLILTSSQTQKQTLCFLPLSRSFISTHFICPVTHNISSNNGLFTSPRMQPIQPQQP